MQASAPSRQRRLSECLLLSVIAAFALWLAQDAARRSPSLENLVMIVPGAVLVVTVGAWLVLGALLRQGTAVEAAPTRFVAKALALLVLLVLLVAGLETVGFDAASFAFLLAAPILLGERRILAVLAFAAVLSTLVVLALQAMLPFHMPTLLL